MQRQARIKQLQQIIASWLEYCVAMRMSLASRRYGHLDGSWKSNSHWAMNHHAHQWMVMIHKGIGRVALVHGHENTSTLNDYTILYKLYIRNHKSKMAYIPHSANDLVRRIIITIQFPIQLQFTFKIAVNICQTFKNWSPNIEVPHTHIEDGRSLCDNNLFGPHVPADHPFCEAAVYHRFGFCSKMMRNTLIHFHTTRTKAVVCCE